MSLKPLATIVPAALVALCLPLFAQEMDRLDPLPPPGGVLALALAHDLYALGMSSGDALTVLTAAGLAASVEMTMAEPAALDPAGFKLAGDSKRKMVTWVQAPAAPDLTDGAPRAVGKAAFAAASSTDDGKAPVDAVAMFATARGLAAEDDALLALIAEGEAREGGVSETAGWQSMLPGGGTEVWQLALRGGAYAELAVIGNGDANLDVAITDQNGTVICRDAGWSDRLSCSFTPASDGYVLVTVQNLGASVNRYYLMAN